MPAVAVNAAPAAGAPSYRTKVTLACDACRRRRVKCNGVMPCSFCSEHGHVCIFDDKNRGRRGPRPRRQVEHKIIHKLAPAAPVAAPVPATPAVKSPLGRKPPAPPPATAITAPRRQSLGTAGATAQRSHPPARRTYSAGALPSLVEVAVEESDDDEGDDARNDHHSEGEDETVPEKIPDVDTWKCGLELLIASDEAIWRGHPSLSLGLLCHLVELFYRHAGLPLQGVVPASYFFPALIAGHIHKSLVLAMSAYSLRFSAHTAAQSVSATGLRADEYLANVTRASLNMSGAGSVKEQIFQVQAASVLLEYEASQSRGRSAWVHIATSKALISTYRDDVARSPEEVSAIHSLESFLTMTQYSHSLGQLSLQRGLTTFDFYVDKQASAADASQNLVPPLRLLVRAQQLCSEPLLKQIPPPWSAGSSYGILQGELEEQILRHADLLSTPSTTEDRAHDVDICMAILLSHCCRIVLNKSFLPIPNHHSSDDGSVTSNERTAEGSIRCFNFPGAPSLFLMERARRCEASAVTICRAAQHLIVTGNFFSHTPLVGFACVQSALVFINYLHRAAKPPDDNMVKRLKFLFIVLAAVRKFYEPAQDWLMTLFRAHNLQTPMATENGSVSDSAFDSYFSRFSDLKEPCFVPFDPPQRPQQQEQVGDKAATTEDGAAEKISSKAAHETQPSSWVHAYSGHLFEDMNSDDETEEHQPRKPPDAQPLLEARITENIQNGELGGNEPLPETSSTHQTQSRPKNEQPAPVLEFQQQLQPQPPLHEHQPEQTLGDLGPRPSLVPTGDTFPRGVGEGLIRENEAVLMPPVNQNQGSDIGMAWPMLAGGGGNVFPPTPQFAELLDLDFDPMDLDPGGLLYPLPLFDINPDMWSSFMLNGGSMPGV